MNALHFKNAVRSIMKYPVYSAMNVLSLTICLAISLVAISIIYNQYNFDTDNPNRDRLVRLNTVITNKDGDKGTFATVPYGLTEKLDKSLFSELVSITPVPSYSISVGNSEVSARGNWLEGNYFKAFNLPILSGDVRQLLDNPNNIALSNSTSLKLFNTTNSIGKTVRIKELGDFAVTLVFDESNSKSVIGSDYLISSKNILSAIKKHQLDSNFVDLSNYTASYTFLLFENDMTKDNSLHPAINNVLKSTAINFSPTPDIKALDFTWIPFKNLAPRTDYWLENSRALSKSDVLILVGVIIIMITLSSFNYASILLALGITRAKEVGIKRLIGAGRRHIFFQFILEAIITALCAYLFAILLFPFVKTIPPFSEMSAQGTYDFKLLLYSIVFAAIVGVIAGLLPAFIVSSQKNLKLMRGVFKNPALKRFSLQKIVLLIQFSLCTIMVVTAVVLFQQSNFMATSDYGFSYKNILSIKTIDSAEHSIVKAELARWPEVAEMSGISTNLGYMPTQEFDIYDETKPERKIQVGSYFIDDKTIPELNLKLLAGSNFDQRQQSNLNHVIINESLMRSLEFSTPDNVLNHQITLDDSTIVQVVGVVKDFHFQNFKRAIAPMLFRYDPGKLEFVNARIHPEHIEIVKARIASAAFRDKIGRTPETTLWEKEYKSKQAHGDGVVLLSFFTIALLAIASLSLIGIVSYSTFQQSKEITIRKIMGASIPQIFFSITREYLILLLISVCIGIPVGYLISTAAVSEFAYRVKPDVITLGLSMSGIALFIFIILIVTTFRRCSMKPAVSLRKL